MRGHTLIVPVFMRLRHRNTVSPRPARVNRSRLCLESKTNKRAVEAQPQQNNTASRTELSRKPKKERRWTTELYLRLIKNKHPETVVLMNGVKDSIMRL